MYPFERYAGEEVVTDGVNTQDDSPELGGFEAPGFPNNQAKGSIYEYSQNDNTKSDLKYIKDSDEAMANEMEDYNIIDDFEDNEDVMKVDDDLVRTNHGNDIDQALLEMPNDPINQLTKEQKTDKILHDKAKTLIPCALAPGRYWVAVLIHTLTPKHARKEKDFLWIKANRVSFVFIK